MVSANEELADTVKELERTKEEYKGIEEDALKVSHPRFYAEQLQKAIAPMHYLSGSFDPLLASNPPKICETYFCLG